MEKIKSIPGRLQIKPGKFGSRIIDDTYNANPTSYKAALHVLASYTDKNCKRYVVLGDMNELGATTKKIHVDAGICAKQAGIDGLFTIGKLSKNAVTGFGTGAFHFDSFDQLSNALLQVLKEKPIVLVKGSRAMQMEHIINILMEDA